MSEQFSIGKSCCFVEVELYNRPINFDLIRMQTFVKESISYIMVLGHCKSFLRSTYKGSLFAVRRLLIGNRWPLCSMLSVSGQGRSFVPFEIGN